MLDDLLGRTALKERIEELEGEVESLEDRLAAEERRRKDAVTEKQEADRRVNELESKVEELRDRLDRAGDDEDERTFRVARAVRDDELADVLDLIASARSGDEALTTVAVPSGESVPDEFETETTVLLRRIESRRGFVAFGDDAGAFRVALVPLVPVGEREVAYGDSFSLKRSLFELPETHAVAVVRSDEYAGGVYDGGGLVAHSSLSPDLKSKHSKGGFSQGRFERARDEEVKRNVRDAVEEFEETVAGHGVETFFVAGESSVTRSFVDELSLDSRVHRRTTDARGSGEALLRRGYETVRAARLYVV